VTIILNTVCRENFSEKLKNSVYDYLWEDWDGTKSENVEMPGIAIILSTVSRGVAAPDKKCLEEFKE
jgi:hypothetical protein